MEAPGPDDFPAAPAIEAPAPVLEAPAPTFESAPEPAAPVQAAERPAPGPGTLDGPGQPTGRIRKRRSGPLRSSPCPATGPALSVITKSARAARSERAWGRLIKFRQDSTSGMSGL